MKILDLFASLTIFIGIIMSLIFSFWLLYPYKEITFLNQPSIVENKIVEAGEYLVTHVEYCKYSKNIPTITRHFVDGLIYTIPTELGVAKELGCGKQIVQIYIPKNLPKGEYFIDTTYRYQVNPIKYLDYTTRTEKFTVK